MQRQAQAQGQLQHAAPDTDDAESAGEAISGMSRLLLLEAVFSWVTVICVCVYFPDRPHAHTATRYLDRRERELGEHDAGLSAALRFGVILK